MATGLDFMSHHHAEGEHMFDQIVTIDEKWVHHFTPKMKSASKQWMAKVDFLSDAEVNATIHNYF